MVTRRSAGWRRNVFFFARNPSLSVNEIRWGRRWQTRWVWDSTWTLPRHERRMFEIFHWKNRLSIFPTSGVSRYVQSPRFTWKWASRWRPYNSTRLISEKADLRLVKKIFLRRLYTIYIYIFVCVTTEHVSLFIRTVNSVSRGQKISKSLLWNRPRRCCDSQRHQPPCPLSPSQFVL